MIGHKISKRGIEVDKVKTEMIEKLTPPIYVKGIRSFLGHIGFYMIFIKDLFKIANPLWKLLENEVKFVFEYAWIKAFEYLKEMLISSPIIVSLDWFLSI